MRYRGGPQPSADRGRRPTHPDIVEHHHLVLVVGMNLCIHVKATMDSSTRGIQALSMTI